jgi:two-component system sensor histidine kinase KdpD
MLLAAQGALRQPLARVRSALDRMAAPDPLATGERRELAARAQADLAYLTAVLTDLHDLAEARAGALDVHLRPVDLDDVLSAAVNDLGPGGHDVVLELPEDMPDVIADANLLARVVTDLTAHAVGRNPSGAVSTVRVVAEPETVTIEVVDHAAAVDATSALSLRVARDLAEAMGAVVTDAWAPGGGLTVSLRLPRAATHTQSRADGTMSAAR